MSRSHNHSALSFFVISFRFVPHRPHFLCSSDDDDFKIYVGNVFPQIVDVVDGIYRGNNHFCMWRASWASFSKIACNVCQFTLVRCTLNITKFHIVMRKINSVRNYTLFNINLMVSTKASWWNILTWRYTQLLVILFH